MNRDSSQNFEAGRKSPEISNLQQILQNQSFKYLFYALLVRIFYITVIPMPTDYVAENDARFLEQLIAFEAGLTRFAEPLGLTPAQIASVTADRKYVAYLTACLEIMRNGARAWTAQRDLFLNDPDDGVEVVTTNLPTFPPPAEPVRPGIKRRYRALARLIKAHPAYNEAIGKALGIITSPPQAPEFASVMPVIAATKSGAAVHVSWGWQNHRRHLDQCEIHVDRGDGHGFTILTFDTTPNHVDEHPHPAVLTKWTYKAIYRAKDRQTGQWSNPVSVIVGGD